MREIMQPTYLERVEHILGSGSGLLDFAIEGENEPRTWIGREDAEWTIEDVDYVENIDEDRFMMHPEGEFFACEIETGDDPTVRCWCND